MTFPPLASQIHCRAMVERLDHLFRVESQGATSFEERDSLEIHPVVEGSLRDAQLSGELVNINESVRVVFPGLIWR